MAFENEKAMVVEFMAICEDRESPAHVIRMLAQRNIDYFNVKIKELKDVDDPTHDVFKHALNDFMYWFDAFNATTRIDVRAKDARQEIRKIVEKYICVDVPESKSEFNLSQSMMKAAIHQMWRKNYWINQMRGHADPMEAVKDAATPIDKREIEYMQALIKDIKGPDFNIK